MEGSSFLACPLLDLLPAFFADFGSKMAYVLKLDSKPNLKKKSLLF